MLLSAWTLFEEVVVHGFGTVYVEESIEPFDAHKVQFLGYLLLNIDHKGLNFTFYELIF